MAPIPGLIGIVTSDMATPLTFHRVLGVTVPAGSDDAPHVEAKLGDGAAIVWSSVDVIRGLDAGYTAPTGGHRITLAFDMGSPGQVGCAYCDLTVVGHHGYVEPRGTHRGQRYVMFHDLDGNSIDLYAWLPAT